MFGLLLLASPAFAWKHTGFYWTEDKFPLQWWMDTAPLEDSLPGFAEDDPTTQIQIIQDSYDNWPEFAACAGLSNTYMGVQDDEDRHTEDGHNVVYWEDPGDEADDGVLGVTYSVGNGVKSKTANGIVYQEMADADIVFNNDVDFGTTEEIAAGGCTSQTSIEAVATHEIGHLHGLDHSCEEHEACSDQDLLEATMFWSEGTCNIGAIDPNIDDVASVNALYGVYGLFEAITPTSGPAPLAVTFAIESDANVIDAHWKFGDGEEGDGAPEISHTYVKSGAYSVYAKMTLEDPECGTTEYAQTEIGYVLTCTAPLPEEGADGFFQVKPLSGLTWQTINRTDMSTYGCVDTIQWEVYEGSDVDPAKLVDLDGNGEGDKIGAWAPKLLFPKEGTYTVLMNVGGPGGIAAGKMTIEVTDLGAAAASCSSTPQLSLVGAALAGLAAIRRRRRG